MEYCRHDNDYADGHDQRMPLRVFLNTAEGIGHAGAD